MGIEHGLETRQDGRPASPAQSEQWVQICIVDICQVSGRVRVSCEEPPGSGGVSEGRVKGNGRFNRREDAFAGNDLGGGDGAQDRVARPVRSVLCSGTERRSDRAVSVCGMMGPPSGLICR